MLRSSLCDNSDAYTRGSGTVTVTEVATGGGNNNIQVVFKSSAPFTDYINEINNAKTDNAKDIDAVMPIYNLI